MSTVLLILFLIAFSFLAAGSIWALSLLAAEERWKALFVGILFPPGALLWMLLKEGQRPEQISRYLFGGLVVAATLFFPLWSTIMALLVFVALETYLSGDS